jgi:FtsP/CotA-like multicopper oxidase with cupredoxin domain
MHGTRHTRTALGTSLRSSAACLFFIALAGLAAQMGCVPAENAGSTDNTGTDPMVISRMGMTGMGTGMMQTGTGTMGMGMGAMTGSAMVSTGTTVDPPVSGDFVDPPEADAMIEVDAMTGRRMVHVNLVAKVTPISVNGTVANLMTYNDSYPGPVIRARQNDMLKIDVTNSLPETAATNLMGHALNITNLHTHGLHVSPKEPSDYVMYKLMPGETYHHLYDLALQPAGTLNLYHPHGHGAVAEQIWAGLIGPLVIEDATDALAAFETHVLVLKDITLLNGEPAPHSTMMDFMMGKEGDVVTVNGRVNPRLAMKAGQVQRWRVMNGSNARFYRVALDEHDLYVIGTDGGLVDKPYPVSELLLSPGERADLLVVGAKTSGDFKLKALPYARMGMGMGTGTGMGMGMMGMGMGASSSQTLTLMTVTYSGEQTPAQALPASVNPAAMVVDPASVTIAAERTMTLSMMMMNVAINGQNFDVDPYTITSTVNTWEKWTIQNASMMDHPFHQHVNAGQVLSITGGNTSYATLHTSIPAWKDTVIVPAMGSITILMPIMDFDGMSMFHCHILEHEDLGMLGLWDVGGTGTGGMGGM